MAMGIPEGPEMGRVMQQLRDVVQAGLVENQREALCRWLQNMRKTGT